MACTILNTDPAFPTNHVFFAPPSPAIIVPKPPSQSPANQEICPQSLSAFKFILVGRLIIDAPPLDMMDLCDDLQSSWNPDSTWRLISIGNNYFSLQFSCIRDHVRISAMASTPLKRRGTMRVISPWAPEFEAYKDQTTGPSITLVRWVPPLPFWIKVNTDGSARGCPGQSSCGGVFRDYRGAVVGCFSQKLGLGFALEAELRACIMALDIAHDQGWNKIWLESDSTELVKLLATRSTMSVPEKLKGSWMRVLGYLKHMEFRVSHIYREGNRVADALANYADAAESGWWPHAIPAISELAYQDAVGCFNTRTRS